MLDSYCGERGASKKLTKVTHALRGLNPSERANQRTKHERKKQMKTIIISVAVSALLALAGCASDTEPTDEGTDETSETESAAVTARKYCEVDQTTLVLTGKCMNLGLACSLSVVSAKCVAGTPYTYGGTYGAFCQSPYRFTKTDPTKPCN